ncbi:hypothetical protein ACKI2N_012820 [Cupriavidus sp. 30B13]|uniref:hypothetical protein n=1 Tax=Cupriavidus sp. 30B13 TaxID=3384241 RepID=UPI003B90E9BE
MPRRSAGTFFAKLIPSIFSDLRRIAGRSNGEVTVEDLQSEAWLVADEIGRGSNVPPDPADKRFHQQILARLYNRFVKFADKRLRFAVRLDEQREDEDGDSRVNAVAAALAAPDGYEPTQALEAREEERTQERELRACFAEAVAYVRVFSNMKNDRLAISGHLAIAACTLRRRVVRAERAVRLQPSLFDGIAVIPEDFMPPRSCRKMFGIGGVGECGPRATGQTRLFARAYVPIRSVQ